MICNKCNAQLADDAVFCTECGNKIEQAIPETPVEQPAAQETTPNAASEVVEKVTETAKTVLDKGTAAAKDVVEKGTAAAKDVVEKVKKTVPANYLKIGLAAVAAILVIVIIAALAGGSNDADYALYIKDGSLMSANMPSGKNLVEITGKLLDSDMKDELSMDKGYELSMYYKLAEDGKTLFYADRIDDDGYTLYVRDITNMKKEPVKIDSDLTSTYHVNEKGNLITYLKDGTLYQHNLKEKTKIDSDVRSYRVTPDGKTLLYLVRESGDDYGTLYLKKGNKDAEKFVSKITSLMYADENLSTILYKKDSDLYQKKGNKDAEKIASDVSSIYCYQNGSFYYTKSENEEIKLWNLIKDDYEDKESSAYQYYAEWLKEENFYMESGALYWYNGKESVEVSESMRYVESTAAETSMVIFTGSESGDLPKVSLTKFINGEVDLYGEIYGGGEDAKYYVAVKDTVAEIKLDDIDTVYISRDAKKLYVGADLDDKHGEINIYEIAVNGGKLKEAKKVVEEVYGYFYMDANGELIYFKDVKNSEGELYWKGNKIDDDVYIYSTSYNDATKDLYYFVDYDFEDNMGTLKYSGGKKGTVVKDDVSDMYFFTEGGETVFLYDYNAKKSEGELWVQNGKKVTKIDEDVCTIVPLY